MSERRRARSLYESSPEMRAPRSGELRCEGGGHFSRFGKTAGLLLREEELIVEGDFEHAAGPFDQLCFEAELASDFVRQTDGSGIVASSGAVFDDKSMIHPNSPFGRII